MGTEGDRHEPGSGPVVAQDPPARHPAAVDPAAKATLGVARARQPAAAQRRSFGHYYLGTIARPRRTFDALMADPRRLRLGLTALAVNAALYTLVYELLTIAHGAPSSFKPWLAISSERYYRYDRLWVAASMVGCVLLAAAVAQLLGLVFGGKGRFEDMVTMFGFATAVACLASLAHDLPDSFLGAIGVIDQHHYEALLNSPTVWRALLLTLYGASLLWFCVLYPKGVGAAQRLKALPAVAVGLTAFAVYQGVFFVFNR